MKKDNFYKVVIVCLLLLNLSLLVFIWTKSGALHEPGDRRPDRIIKERLKLNDEQQQAFERLKEEHHSQMMGIMEHSRVLHDSLFNLLQQDVIDQAAATRILENIAENNKRKDMVTFEHFRKIKNILLPVQKPLFNDLVAELASVLDRPAPPGGPPPERR